MMEDSPKTPWSVAQNAQTKEKAEGFDEVRFVWDAAAKCFWVCTGRSVSEVEKSATNQPHRPIIQHQQWLSSTAESLGKPCRGGSKFSGKRGEMSSNSMRTPFKNSQGKEHLRKWILEAKSTTWLDGKDWVAGGWRIGKTMNILSLLRCKVKGKRGKGLTLFISVIAFFLKMEWPSKIR